MPAEERDLVGSSAALIEGNDSKGATTTSFPIDCDVFGIGLDSMSTSSSWSRARESDLDQVRVPGVLGDAEVVIALFL